MNRIFMVLNLCIELRVALDTAVPELRVAVDTAVPELRMAVDTAVPELRMAVDTAVPEFHSGKLEIFQQYWSQAWHVE